MLTKIINNYFCASENYVHTQPQTNPTQLTLYYGDQKNFYNDISRFYQYLSKMEISRSKRFLKKTDERTYVIAHALVNRKISELLAKDFNNIRINYFDNKKPFVEGSLIDFNLSHSSDYFAFAIANDKNTFVGVDIEVVRENLDITQITNNYFHKNEIDYILNNNSNDFTMHRKFYEIWTRKEALLKMLGTGLTENLLEIDMRPGEREIFIQNNIDLNFDYFSNIYVYTLNIFENIFLSLSINRPLSIVAQHCDSF